jgi:hypothetical protein
MIIQILLDFNIEEILKEDRLRIIQENGLVLVLLT